MYLVLYNNNNLKKWNDDKYNYYHYVIMDLCLKK